MRRERLVALIVSVAAAVAAVIGSARYGLIGGMATAPAAAVALFQRRRWVVLPIAGLCTVLIFVATAAGSVWVDAADARAAGSVGVFAVWLIALISFGRTGLFAALEDLLHDARAKSTECPSHADVRPDSDHPEPSPPIQSDEPSKSLANVSIEPEIATERNRVREVASRENRLQEEFDRQRHASEAVLSKSTQRLRVATEQRRSAERSLRALEDTAGRELDELNRRASAMALEVEVELAKRAELAAEAERVDRSLKSRLSEKQADLDRTLAALETERAELGRSEQAARDAEESVSKKIDRLQSELRAASADLQVTRDRRDAMEAMHSKYAEAFVAHTTELTSRPDSSEDTRRHAACAALHQVLDEIRVLTDLCDTSGSAAAESAARPA